MILISSKIILRNIEVVSELPLTNLSQVAILRCTVPKGLINKRLYTHFKNGLRC